MDINVGLMGELLVEQRLVKHGWHPVRLNTAALAVNADLIAVKGRVRVTIQVKTTRGEGHSHAGFLGFGYATNYLKNGARVFNSKESPLMADVIVAVHYTEARSRFVVLPVVEAEALCREHANYWHNNPRRDGSHRTTNFPLYLCFTATPGTHAIHHEKMRQSLIRREEDWGVFDAVSPVAGPDRIVGIGANA